MGFATLNPSYALTTLRSPVARWVSLRSTHPTHAASPVGWVERKRNPPWLPDMLDKPAEHSRPSQATGPRLDFQEHLADLEARGLLVRIDRPINKDTELHPLVRWQFIGGMPEDERARVPVHQRRRRQGPALRHAGGGRRARRLAATSTRSAWAGRSRRSARPGCTPSPHPIAPVVSPSPLCQEVVVTGDDAARARRRARAPAGADLDAGLRCRAVSHGDALHHARSRERHPEHGHLPRGAEGDRPARRAHGGARGDRRRRLSALAQISRAQASRCRSRSSSAARRS